jgi:predicted small lipoprotein YifL
MRRCTLVLTATMALLLAGCGVRGDLELPPSATTPEATADGQATPQGATPVEDRPFILDGLLL